MVHRWNSQCKVFEEEAGAQVVKFQINCRLRDIQTTVTVRVVLVYRQAPQAQYYTVLQDLWYCELKKYAEKIDIYLQKIECCPQISICGIQFPIHKAVYISPSTSWN